MSYVSKFLASLRRIKESLLNMLRNGKKVISRKSMKEVVDASKGDDPKVNEAIDDFSEAILPEEKIVEESSQSKGNAKVLTGIAGRNSSQTLPFLSETKE